MILETKSTADLESVCPRMLVIPLRVSPRWAVVYKYKNLNTSAIPKCDLPLFSCTVKVSKKN
jgi:hypothetical protein